MVSISLFVLFGFGYLLTTLLGIQDLVVCLLLVVVAVLCVMMIVVFSQMLSIAGVMV